MDRKNSVYMEMGLRNLLFLFVGDLRRGKRIQEAVNSHGWKIHIETELGSEPNKGDDYTPDLVILDGFPESEVAKSVYYKLQHFSDVIFLALNNSPNDMKYLHVNRFSFLKIINRDPKPKELIDAIFDLVQSNRKLLLHSIRREGLICDIQAVGMSAHTPRIDSSFAPKARRSSSE